MSDNLYSPPQAPLLHTEVQEQRAFYVVSRGKFLTLFVLTFGLYQLFWAYQNWRQFKQATQQPMWPMARAFFAIFWTHALYREADAWIKQNGRSHGWRHAELATWFVLLAIASKVLDALVRKNIGAPLLDFINLALIPLQAVVTFEGQRGLNVAGGDPQGQSNARFTPINYVFIVIGVVLWLLVGVGLLVTL